MEGHQHHPPPYPVQPGSQSSHNMPGFGSADITTPFNYGSVEDGRYRQDSLEQKLRKQYWKTKQTVIEKLGKSQDEFVVAGDADIDMKLEKAFHLQSSCDELLSALDKYISRIRAASVHERVMGEHLRTWSETEYTNAGEVMQNVGKIQEGDAKKRLAIESSLQRMQSEFMVFRVTAIRDLGLSIQRLQKARTEYRAALLWMKDVSEKLQNPDYRNQLFKFREAQVAVKESKQRYEKMKFDLGEKIDMVSASRCNLLSRSLPNYQKEILSFFDNAANDFHKVLVDLRSHHHHQYKVRRLAEEIRDLELEESPFNDESGLLGKPKHGSTDDDVPLLDVGNGSTGEAGASPANNTAEEGKKEAPPQRMLGSDQLSIEKIQEEAKVKDLALSGIEAELRELQKEVLQPSSDVPVSSAQQQSSHNPSQSDQQTQPQKGLVNDDKEELNEFRDLLQLEDDEEAANGASKALQPSQDKLFDDWSSFSAFMSTTDPDDERTKSPTSGWEKDLMSPPADDNSFLGLESQEGGVLSPTLVPQIVNGGTPAAATGSDAQKNQSDGTATDAEKSGEAGKHSKDGKTGNESGDLGAPATAANTHTAGQTGRASDLLSEDLKALGISPESKAPRIAPKPAALAAGLDSLDPSYFTQQQLPPQSIMAGLPQFPTPMMTMPMVPPSFPGQPPQQHPQMFRSPQSNSQRPILAPALAPTNQMPGPGFTMPPQSGLARAPNAATGMGSGLKANGRYGGADGQDKSKEKAASWMNVFAHLDPLVNEKV